MKEDFKLIEGEIVPVYENEKGERLIDARELHAKLENKRKFVDWIKQRIEQYDFIAVVPDISKGNQYYQIYYKLKRQIVKNKFTKK